MSSTRLIAITPEAEKTMLYIARVSSSNQTSTDTGLLGYCMQHGHWSVFEHAHMTVEITTSRAIARQLLRHKSFSFSEFSQRYAEVTEWITYTPRLQAKTNRQSSTKRPGVISESIFMGLQWGLQQASTLGYRIALTLGISRESARFLLLETASTRLYMTGSIRSWIHYIQLRTDMDTQLEHRKIAHDVRKILSAELPTIGKVL